MNDPVDDVRPSAAYGLSLHEAGIRVDMRFYAKDCHPFELRPTSDPIRDTANAVAVVHAAFRRIEFLIVVVFSV
jgi:hypothetical protein